MRKIISGLALGGVLWLVACTATTPTPSASTSAAQPTLVAPSGYRPVQAGDVVEGVTIGYQFVFPSIEHPVLVIAASPYILHFIAIKESMAGGLVPYIQDLPKNNRIYAFDENDPNQGEPKLMAWDATKPVEVVFIPLPDGKHNWSVSEGEDQIEAAYKIVRRRDGGLRFVDAYGKNAIYSAGGIYTTNGTGVGLMLSARLGLLKTILSDPKYQRGTNVMQHYPPNYDQYDPRIIKLDPSKEGLNINRDWVIITRPGPAIGLPEP